MKTKIVWGALGFPQLLIIKMFLLRFQRIMEPNN